MLRQEQHVMAGEMTGRVCELQGMCEGECERGLEDPTALLSQGKPCA